jgi:hypothetical protein
MPAHPYRLSSACLPAALIAASAAFASVPVQSSAPLRDPATSQRAPRPVGKPHALSLAPGQGFAITSIYFGLMNSISAQSTVRVNPPDGALRFSLTMGSMPYAAIIFRKVLNQK